MALNIAVPLSGVEGFYEGFGLLSPISPISHDCREQLKVLVSPVDSESSGVSSLDSEDLKKSNATKQKPTPTQSSTPNPSPLPIITNEAPTLISSSPLPPPSPTRVLITAPQKIETPIAKHAEKKAPSLLSPSVTPSPTSSVEEIVAESTPNTSVPLSLSSQMENLEVTSSPTPAELVATAPPKRVRYFSGNYDHDAVQIGYQGRRDILLLGEYMKDESTWVIPHAVLPPNNIPMFLSNRSQYHRLGASGHAQEFNLSECNQCSFRYPINQGLWNEPKQAPTPIGRPNVANNICNVVQPMIETSAPPPAPPQAFNNRFNTPMRQPPPPINNPYGYYNNGPSYQPHAVNVGGGGGGGVSGGGQQQNMQYGNNFWQCKQF